MKKLNKNIIFYVIFFIFCLALSTIQDKLDFDLFSRLIMGKHVIQTGYVMYNDIVSYTPCHMWIDHEWLSSSILYLVLTIFGPVGLTCLKALLIFLSIALINFNIINKNKTYDYKILYTLIITAFFFHFETFGSLRCQTFTYIFYPILIYLLEKQRQNENSKAIWFIPLLSVVWLNFHGASMYAFGIIFLYGISQILNKQPFKKYFIVLILNALVYFINPWGVDLISFLFTAISTDRQYIGEWQWSYEYFQFISVFVIYIYGFIKQRMNNVKFDYTKLLILLATFLVALRYIKFNPMFMITCAIFVYEDFKILLDDINKFLKNKLYILNYLILAFMVGFSIFAFTKYDIKTNYYKNSIQNYPIKPLSFLNNNHIEGKVFAPYYSGAFIAYKNYPKMKIYMDGRQEQVYTYDIFRKQMEFLFLKSYDAIKVLQEYEPDIILIDRAWMANEYLYKYQNYFKLAYEDDKYLIYLGPNAQKFGYHMNKENENYNIENFFKTQIDFKRKKRG